MTLDGEVLEKRRMSPFPDDQIEQLQQQQAVDYWTMEMVLRWLELNDFKQAMDVFKAKHICGKVFLDIDMPYLKGMQNEIILSSTDIQKLAQAIKSIRPSEDYYSNGQIPGQQQQYHRRLSNTGIPSARFNNNNGGGSRYGVVPTVAVNESMINNGRLPSSESVIPLIPERKSSNNEQVLDWMKTFNIPKRPIPSANAIRNNSNSNSSGRLVTPTTASTASTPLSAAFPTSTSTLTFSSNNSSSNNNNNSYRYPLSPNSPRTLETDANWKVSRRRQQAQAANNNMGHQAGHQQEQSIYVTRDYETFLTVQVTGMHDPHLIKSSILRKLGLEGSSERYSFFHQNGNHSETPLNEIELSHICQISDQSSMNRILVKPAADHALEQYRLYSKDGGTTSCYDFALQGGYQRPQQQRYYTNDQQQPRLLNSTSMYNGDYDLNRSRYDLTGNSSSGMISPINGNSQFTISSPPGGMEDSRDDSGYFDRSGRTSRKQSMDADASVWSTHPPPSLDANNRTTPIWNTVTPQSQRSSTSSTDTQKHLYQQQMQQQQQQMQMQQQGLWPVHSASEMNLSSSYGDNYNSLPPWSTHQENNSYIQQQQQYTEPTTWAVPPKPQHEETLTTSQSLWAIPPSNNNIQSRNSNVRSHNNEFDMNSASVSATNYYTSSNTNTTTLTSSVSLWAVAPNNVSTPTPSPSMCAIAPNQQQQSSGPTPSPSLWAVAPTVITAVNSTQQTGFTSPSLWAVAPQSSSQQLSQAGPTPSPSLWAIPPSHDEHRPSSDDNNDSLLPPIQQFSSENLNLHPSISNKTYNNPPLKGSNKRGVQFSATGTDTISEDESSPAVSIEDSVSAANNTSSAPTMLEEGIKNISLSDLPMPSHQDDRRHSARDLHINTSNTTHSSSQQLTPISSPSTAKTIQTSESSSGNTNHSDENEENWAERPSVDRLCKDIDKYLPGHDLDKEIILNPITTPSTTPPSNAASNVAAVGGGGGVTGATIVNVLPPGRKLGGHQTSIRKVVHKAHDNWRNAVNVIRANNIIRRKSTKMWHRAVEQVKPGMSIDSRPKSKKLQWVRGELIGKGSFGRVYHALNVEASEWIAVKQVDLPTTRADYNNPQLREIKDGLFREISLLEDLDNEYVVQYLGYDVDEEEGHINIFLEYVPGGSIASCLSKTGKFEIPLVQFFTGQILMGLAYLHDRNVLHRDIKAGNILLDENGICKITDFGLSKLSGQEKAYDPHSNNSVMRGTVFWMAPEVVKGTNYNAKVDIWSLGCTVIEMMTGSHPWLDLNMLAALYSLGKYQAPPIPENIPDIARDFLEKCFIINPEERPTAEQLLTHPFVQSDPQFEFKKHMKKAEIVRRASRKVPTISVQN